MLHLELRGPVVDAYVPPGQRLIALTMNELQGPVVDAHVPPGQRLIALNKNVTLYYIQHSDGIYSRRVNDIIQK